MPRMTDPWWKYSPITRQDIAGFLLLVLGGEIVILGVCFFLELLGRTLLTLI
jgi:hypothetical protein